jgi:hypothetical protein
MCACDRVPVFVCLCVCMYVCVCVRACMLVLKVFLVSQRFTCFPNPHSCHARGLALNLLCISRLNMLYLSWFQVSQASAGLFSGAIMESGSCDAPQFFQSLDYAQTFSREYAAGCGCPQTGGACLIPEVRAHTECAHLAAWPLTSADALLECLRGLTTADLIYCNMNTTATATAASVLRQIFEVPVYSSLLVPLGSSR